MSTNIGLNITMYGAILVNTPAHVELSCKNGIKNNVM